MSLGTLIAKHLDHGDLRQAFALAFVPSQWRREHCVDSGKHQVIFMHSGDWYCYECGTYDEPCGSEAVSDYDEPDQQSE